MPVTSGRTMRTPASAHHGQPPLTGIVDRCGEAAERYGTGIFLTVSVLYLAFAWFFAARKLLWNDELYSYYVATLPTMSDVWAALRAGGEQTPPLFYAITRGVFAMLGTGNLAIRLPEIAAFWAMSACLYVFVRRRTSNLTALVAATLPLVTYGFQYSYEARPYALVLGFGTLALLAWQSTARGRARAAWLACLAIALAATVSSHYYGLFVLAPIGLGEAVRTVERRRLDPAVWGVMALALVPLLFHLPLLRAGAAYSGAFWSPPQWVNLPDFYVELLQPALVPLVAILLVALVARRNHADPGWTAPLDPPVPASEISAAFGFVLIPAVAVVTAKLVTGAFVNRYALVAVVGFAVLAGFGTAIAFRRRPGLQLVALLAVVGWFTLSQAREAIAPTGVSIPISAAAVARPAQWAAAVGDDSLPLVIADPHTFAVLSHYSSGMIRSRIVYLADPARALASLGHNSVERGMLDLLGPWFHMHVVPFEGYIATHDRFLVYGDFVRLAFLNWIVPELQAQGFHLEMLDRAGDNMMLLATRRAPPDQGR